MRSRIGLTILVLALFVLALVRLRRVPRPRFEPETRYARGRVVEGRVVLGVGHQPGRLIGYSIVCGDRELLSHLGNARYVIHPSADGESVEVRSPDGNESVRVRAADCSVRRFMP